MVTIIVIYFIGVVVAFYLLMRDEKRTRSNNYRYFKKGKAVTWGDVLSSAGLSLLSWLLLALMALAYSFFIFYKIGEWWDNIKNKNAPEWLQ